MRPSLLQQCSDLATDKINVELSPARKDDLVMS
jgi:hypothetical protein